jgi:hypothetical protein
VLGTYGGFTWIFSGNEIRSVNVPANVPTSLVGAYNAVGCAITATVGCNGAFPLRDFAGTNTPTAITRSGDPFVFDKVDLTSLRGTQSLTIEGFLGGLLEFTTTAALTISRQTFTFGGPAIDQVRIFQANGTDPWVMDNFRYSAPVPEPGSIAFLVAGLVLLGAASTRGRS